MKKLLIVSLLVISSSSFASNCQKLLNGIISVEKQRHDYILKNIRISQIDAEILITIARSIIAHPTSADLTLPMADEILNVSKSMLVNTKKDYDFFRETNEKQMHFLEVMKLCTREDI